MRTGPFISMVLTGAFAVAVAQPAFAQSITYVVKQTIGSGSVAGTIGTDGTTGTLATGSIKTWDLTLNGAGATYNLTNANSAVVIIGNATAATATSLTFDASAATASYLLFQNGLYSGSHYWCNASSAGACRQGATVAPNSAFDSSAQFQALSGIQLLGSASPMFVTTTDAINKSLSDLAISQRAQLITSNLFSSVLLGKNEQVSCGDCGGAGVTFGSISFSAHGRKELTPELTALFGVAAGRFEEKGAYITHSYTFAGGLRFDPANMGRSRPYLEIGGAIAPDQKATYQRAYATGDGTAIGIGQTRSTNASLYARAGWVARLTPRDELGGSITMGHSWQTQRAYAEASGDANPFDAQFGGGTSQTNMIGLGAQYSHLFGRRVEVAVDGSLVRSFGSTSSVGTMITGMGTTALPAAAEITYFSPGTRVSFRVARTIKIDTFINATIANHGIGTGKHGGFGVNVAF